MQLRTYPFECAVGLSELLADLFLNLVESHRDDRGVMMIALPDAFLPACVVSAEM